MKNKLRAPRCLPHVIRAIYELKETGGSNVLKILNHVKAAGDVVNSFSDPRNLSSQVRRALRHATTNGIVKQRAGKFRLDMNFLDPFKDCDECRRRKRMRKRKKTRRRRKRSGNHDDVSVTAAARRRTRRRKRPTRKRARRSRSMGRRVANLEEINDEETTSEKKLDPERLIQEAARRRRKRKRKTPTRKRSTRKRGRRSRSMGKRVASLEDVNDEDTANEKKLEPEMLIQDVVYPDDLPVHEGQEIEDQVQCDNANCLCNVKEDDGAGEIPNLEDNIEQD